MPPDGASHEELAAESDARLILGRQYRDTGNLEEAVRMFYDAALLDRLLARPSAAESARELASVTEALGEVEAAAKLHESAALLEKDPSAIGWRAELDAQVSAIARLGEEGRLEEKAEVEDLFIRELAGSADSHVQWSVAHVTIGKARTLASQGEHEQALELLEGLVQRLRAIDKPELEDQLVEAIALKVYCLDRVGRRDEVADVASDAISRFGETPGNPYRVEIARFYRMLTLNLLLLGEHDGCVIWSVTGESRLRDDETVRAEYVNVQLHHAYSLMHLGRRREAEDIYFGILRTHGDSPDPVLVELAAEAVADYGELELKCYQDAQRARVLFQVLLERFSTRGIPALDSRIERARQGLAKIDALGEDAS